MTDHNHARRLGGIAAVLLILLGAPLASALTPLTDMTPEKWAETTHVPDPSWELPIYNTLIVDAATGEVLQWDNQGGALTTVEVQGVSPDMGGFALHNPTFETGYLNKTSTPDGRILFFYQTILPGEWTVEHVAEDGKSTTVTTFEAPSASGLVGSVLGLLSGSLDSLTASSSSTRYGNGCPSCGRPPCSNYWYQVGVGDRLVPLSIVHSPYAGSGTMNRDYTRTKAFVAGPFGTSSSITESFRQDSNSGQTTGVFKWARWVESANYNNCHNPYNREQQSSQTTYYANVDYWYSGWFPQGVWGSSTETDRDDKTYIGGSVSFDHRYAFANFPVDTRTAGGNFYLSTRNQATTTFSAGTTVYSNRWYDFSVKATAEWAATSYYDYTFPPNHVWYGNYVRASEQVVAFCHVSSYTQC